MEEELDLITYLVKGRNAESSRRREVAIPRARILSTLVDLTSKGGYIPINRLCQEEEFQQICEYEKMFFPPIYIWKIFPQKHKGSSQPGGLVSNMQLVPYLKSLCELGLVEVAVILNTMGERRSASGAYEGTHGRSDVYRAKIEEIEEIRKYLENPS